VRTPPQKPRELVVSDTRIGPGTPVKGIVGRYPSGWIPSDLRVIDTGFGKADPD